MTDLTPAQQSAVCALLNYAPRFRSWVYANPEGQVYAGSDYVGRLDGLVVQVDTERASRRVAISPDGTFREDDGPWTASIPVSQLGNDWRPATQRRLAEHERAGADFCNDCGCYRETYLDRGDRHCASCGTNLGSVR